MMSTCGVVRKIRPEAQVYSAYADDPAPPGLCGLQADTSDTSSCCSASTAQRGVSLWRTSAGSHVPAHGVAHHYKQQIGRVAVGVEDHGAVIFAVGEQHGEIV